MKVVLVRADTFPNAAGALDSSWTRMEENNTYSVQYDGAGNATIPAADIAFNTGALDAANVYDKDQYARIKGGVVSANGYVGPVTRGTVFSVGVWSRYELFGRGAPNDMYLQKTVRGAGTTLASLAPQLLAADWLELRSYGPTQEALINGVSQVKVTDYSVINGRGGLLFFTNPATPHSTISDYEGGSLYDDTLRRVAVPRSQRRG